MNLIKLRILGIVSDDVISSVSKGLTRQTNGNNYLDFFCSYSDLEIQLGTKFCKVTTENYEAKIDMKLIDVTQQWGIPFDCIPAGHKTIGRFEVLEGDLTSLRKLFGTVSSWGEASNFFEIFSC